MLDIIPRTPKVSVIIPLYNKVQYIRRTIESVLSQTIQDFEVIIVNDGSTDGGEMIVEEYDDSRIHLINQVNQGVSAARNQGVHVACSELIAFLDADDEWKPEHIEILLRLQNKFPEADVFGTAYQVITPHKRYSRVLDAEKGERILKSYFEERVQAGIQNYFLMTSAVAVHKSLFQRIGGYHTHFVVGEDLDLYERLAIHSKIAYSPAISAIYHNELPNNTRHLVRSLPFIKWDNIDKLCEEVNSKNNDILAECRQYAEMMYSSIGCGNAIRGHRKESREVWKKVPLTQYPLLRLASYTLNVLPDCIRKKIMDVWYGL